jgi:hypothetical protein
LAEALTQEGDIAGLANVIADTISENGRQGYSDGKDFISTLRKSLPDAAQKFGEEIQCQLKGKALRRFHKLLINRPPVEGDFDKPVRD